MTIKKLKEEIEDLKRIVNAPDWSFDLLLEKNPKYQKYEKIYRDSINRIYEDAVRYNKVHVKKAIESIRENDPYW